MSTSAAAPITVLHVDTERGWRGGEQHVLWLARALERAGHHSMIAARPGEPLAVRAAARDLAVLPAAPSSELSVATALALRAAMLRRHVQIAHAHTAHSVALVALATLGTSVRMVLTRHIDFRLKSNVGTRWKYGRADAMIAVSAAVADSLLQSGVPRDRVEVISGGVELRDLPSAPPRSALEPFGIPADAPLAVMVGALVPQKDPVTFVRALARARAHAPLLHGLLVGEGELRRDVEQAIEAEGVHGAVHLAGWRDDADALLALADVAVLSSRNEGLPVVFMNALGLGKPIASTAAGGIPEMIERTGCGLVVAVGDADALGDAIAGIVLDPALAMRLGAAARSHAHEYSIDHVAERTAAVYRRVLSA